MQRKRKEVLIIASLVGAWLGSAFGYVQMANAADVDNPRVRIEITRDVPYDKTYTIVREFDDMEELTMWFVNKMENAGCDPYVTKVELFPLGKEAHRE